MPQSQSAAHVLSRYYPELMTDDVSRYVTHIKEKLGPAKSSAIYAHACRAAPVADNPMGLRRGSVVEIEGERYLALGCGFMTLEFASLNRLDQLRTIGKDEFVRLGKEKFKVLDEEESHKLVDEVIASE